MYYPFPLTVEVYEKKVFYNDSGQERSDWILSRTVKCDFAPARAEERLVGRVQNPTSFIVYTEDTNIDNDNQFRNFRDRYGNIVEKSTFNIIGIRKHMGFTKIDHLSINAQKVLD